MSVAIAKGLYGIGVKGPQDRRRRQMEDEQFEREGERHDLSMKQGQLGIQSTEQQMDIRGDQAERQETRFEWDEADRADVELARRTQEELMKGVLKFEAEGDPSGLISAYSEGIEEIEGYNEVQTPHGKRAFQFQLANGETRIMPVHTYSDQKGNVHMGMMDLAIGASKEDPSVIAKARSDALSRRAEAQEAQAEREHEMRMPYVEEDARAQREMQIEEMSERSGVEREEISQIERIVGKSLGLDQDRFSFDTEDGQKYLRATSIATNAVARSREIGEDLDLATAAMIAREAVDGPLSDEEAKKIAGEEAKEKGIGGAERSQYIDGRVEGLKAESMAARASLERLGGISELAMPVGQRGSFSEGAAEGDITGATDQALGIGGRRGRQQQPRQEPPAQESQPPAEGEPGSSKGNPIPIEDLQGRPAPGTYILRNGEVFQYQPQGQR